MGSAKERTLTKFYTKRQDLYGYTYLITTTKIQESKKPNFKKLLFLVPNFNDNK